MRRAEFYPSALATIREFSPELRRELGEAITDLQRGALLHFPISRPMPSVAPGVSELRLMDRSGAYRVFYSLKLRDAVVIFHAFQKKTRTTPRREIELGRKRLEDMLNG